MSNDTPPPLPNEKFSDEPPPLPVERAFADVPPPLPVEKQVEEDQPPIYPLISLRMSRVTKPSEPAVLPQSPEQQEEPPPLPIAEPPLNADKAEPSFMPPLPEEKITEDTLPPLRSQEVPNLPIESKKAWSKLAIFAFVLSLLLPAVVVIFTFNPIFAPLFFLGLLVPVYFFAIFGSGFNSALCAFAGKRIKEHGAKRGGSLCWLGCAFSLINLASATAILVLYLAIPWFILKAESAAWRQLGDRTLSTWQSTVNEVDQCRQSFERQSQQINNNLAQLSNVGQSLSAQLRDFNSQTEQFNSSASKLIAESQAWRMKVEELQHLDLGQWIHERVQGVGDYFKSIFSFHQPNSHEGTLQNNS